jgi:hypothetical protein
MFLRLLLVSLVAALSPVAAAAQSCPGHPDALGTTRVLAVGASTTPRVGRKQFPETLPLGPKELVLTFDDGPWPTTTPVVLKALAAECVHATFFLLGRNAQAHPELARREAAEGHSIGHHSFSHPLLDRKSPDAAMAEIDKGIRADEAALGTTAVGRRDTPFFRFPGFASTPLLLDRLEAKGIVVFGADVGERLECADPGGGTEAAPGAYREGRSRHRPPPRHARADGSYAPGPAPGAEGARLPHRPRRTGGRRAAGELSRPQPTSSRLWTAAIG